MVSSSEQKDESPPVGSGGESGGTTTGGSGGALSSAPNAATVQMVGLPLDWTQGGGAGTGHAHPADRIRYPSDVTDLDLEETELIIVGTAGQKITNIGPDFSEKYVSSELTTLILRSHLIRKMEGLSRLTKLDLLELYDNQIEALQGLDDEAEKLWREQKQKGEAEEEEEDGSDSEADKKDDADAAAAAASPAAGTESGENEAAAATTTTAEGGGGPGPSLRVLDMSYNAIRDMAPVQFCPNLQELYLANNKLKSMCGLRNLTKLRKIDLGANRIRVMEEGELSGLVNLEELWLGKNKIEKIQGLDNLTKLRRLDVQSNRLTAVENLSSQAGTLEELYLAHNGITAGGASSSPTGLSQDFAALNVLDLSRNRLTDAEPFKHLKTVEELWLSGNEIKSFDDVRCLSALGEGLETVYLEYNPLQQDPLYRKKLKELIPSLQQIDANLITGLAAHGMTPPAGLQAETEEQRIRKLQDTVIERAKAETEQKKKQNEQQEK